MELAEIRALVHQVAGEIRVPVTLRDGQPNELSGEILPLTDQEKVAAIEGYMVDIALARGELEHGRVVIQDSLHGLQAKGRALPWQNYLQGVKKPTQAQVAEAKRKADPDLAESIFSARDLLELLKMQLDRLEKDQESMSRLYTVVTGG